MENQNINCSKQAKHPLVMVPGPVEFEDSVLEAMAHPAESHVSPSFVSTFQSALLLTRKVLGNSTSNGGQPFILSGAGTLGWDVVASNLATTSDKVLVINTGFFADSFAECFETYGLNTTQIKATARGKTVPLDDIKKTISNNFYKIITITHVDTSTGVLSDIKAIAKLIRSVSPQSLIIVDGVCSVAAEEIRFDQWDLDVVLTASQKALGTPPGLSVLLISQRALDYYKSHNSTRSYYASLKKWLPIMQAYESGKAAYFSTPAVQSIHALKRSLEIITSIPLEQTFQNHINASNKIKSTISSWGLKQIAQNENEQAHGMTAVYVPNGIDLSAVLSNASKNEVVFAGGLLKDVNPYFRIGHMGVSVSKYSNYIDVALKALHDALLSAGYKFPN